MKSKKGFTLIELLAIIVILAIIAVITVPIILNIIEKANVGAVKNSAYGYKDAISKFYVSKLAEDSDYEIPDGVYAISDLDTLGVIYDGKGPDSNSWLDIRNNEVLNGCLAMGDYKVTFANGEVTNPEKGKCGTILYFTYDSKATKDSKFSTKHSAKLTEPDSSWKFYIKETTIEGIPSYGIELTVKGSRVQLRGIFDTVEECEKATVDPRQAYLGNNLQCKALETKTIYEVIGVENYGTQNAVTFSLKPNDWINTVNTLKTIFPSCNAAPSAPVAACSGSSVFAYDDATYGNVYVSDDSVHCIVRGIGSAECSDTWAW